MTDDRPTPLTLFDLLKQMEDAQSLALRHARLGKKPVRAKDVHGALYTVLAVGADEQDGSITFIIEED